MTNETATPLYTVAVETVEGRRWLCGLGAADRVFNWVKDRKEATAYSFNQACDRTDWIGQMFPQMCPELEPITEDLAAGELEEVRARGQG